jgi:hypothetical protein
MENLYFIQFHIDTNLLEILIVTLGDNLHRMNDINHKIFLPSKKTIFYIKVCYKIAIP